MAAAPTSRTHTRARSPVRRGAMRAGQQTDRDDTTGTVLGPGEGRRLTFPGRGATMIFKAVGQRPTGGFTFAEFTAEPGFLPRPHIHHTHEELFYVVEGEFEFVLGDRTVRAGPGTFVHVPPGVLHGFANRTDAPARYVGTIAPPTLEHYFEELATLFGAGGPPDFAAQRALREKYQTDEPEPS